jgi:hypothetical protein
LPIAVAVLVAGYAVLLLRNTSYAAGGPDESGYMNAARLFAQGKIELEVEPLRRLQLGQEWREVFTPLGFRGRGPTTIVPTYPPGLPIHLIAGGYLVSPVLGLGCLLLMYAIGRELGLDRAHAGAAAAILAVTPQFIMFSLQVMSDVPATFWALAACWLALRSRRHTPFAIAAGTAFAVGVCVRPTNALLIVPLAAALRFRKGLAGFAAAGAVPVLAALLSFQTAAYGSPFSTGYGGIADVLHLEGYVAKIFFYSKWMARIVTPLVAPLALLVVVDRQVSGADRALLALWYLPFLAFYAAWEPFEEWWYVRFLLPATPALIIAAMLLLRDWVRRRAIAAMLVAVMLYVPWKFSSDRRVLRVDDDQAVYSGAMLWSERLIPHDAVVISGVLSGAFLFYQNRFTARWDYLDPARFAELKRRATCYAVLSDVEVRFDDFLRRAPGRWVPVSRFRDVTLYRLDP